jgi:steroid delta-isomerase-like uncharacterized protein
LTVDDATERDRAAAATDTGGAPLRKRMDVVLEHMNAENEHEFERCIDAFTHPRYEIIATGEIYDGPGEVASLLNENKRAFPDFHFDVRRMRDADEAVIVEGDFRGTHQGLWRGLPPTGRAVDFPVIIVFEFEGDRMVCERTYFDLGTPLRQLGVARDPNTRSGRIAAALNHPVTVGRAVFGELRRRTTATQPQAMAEGAREPGVRPLGWRPQAVVGAEITNAVSGERLVFLQTHASSQGKLFQAEISMPAGNYVIESHFHPSQVERFEVISGQLGVRVGNAILYITEGQDAVVPVRTTHSYWNAGRGELRILYEHRPALVSAEVFFLTYFGLSRAGKLSSTGQMNLLQSAVLIRDVGDFIRPPQPPLAIQDPLFAPLAALGEMLGYRPWYPEYLDTMEPPA